MIFVFGSNEAGVHGAGAARTAREHHGAVLGHGFGPAGNSFAIPTKDWQIFSLPIETVKFYVDRFIIYARLHPQYIFQVTAIGCGLAGFRHDVIAPLFKYAPQNCQFDSAWEPYLGPKKAYWGTF
jgi:hypothetical protein